MALAPQGMEVYAKPVTAGRCHHSLASWLIVRYGSLESCDVGGESLLGEDYVSHGI